MAIGNVAECPFSLEGKFKFNGSPNITVIVLVLDEITPSPVLSCEGMKGRYDSAQQELE